MVQRLHLVSGDEIKDVSSNVFKDVNKLHRLRNEAAEASLTGELG